MIDDERLDPVVIDGREVRFKEQVDELASVVLWYPLEEAEVHYRAVRACEAKGWVTRDAVGRWIPTGKGIVTYYEVW